MEEKEKVIKFIEGNRRDMRRRGVTIGIADEKGNIKSYNWDKDNIRARLSIIKNRYDKDLKHMNGKNRIVGVKDFDGTPFNPDAKKKESKGSKESYKNKVYDEMVKKSKDRKKQTEKPESSLIDKDGNVEIKDDKPKSKPKTKKTDNKSGKK